MRYKIGFILIICGSGLLFYGLAWIASFLSDTTLLTLFITLLVIGLFLLFTSGVNLRLTHYINACQKHSNSRNNDQNCLPQLSASYPNSNKHHKTEYKTAKRQETTKYKFKHTHNEGL